MPSLTVTPVVFGDALREALSGVTLNLNTARKTRDVEGEFKYGRFRITGTPVGGGLYLVRGEFLSFAGFYQDFPGASWDRLVELRAEHKLNVHMGTVLHLFLTREKASFMVVITRGEGACDVFVPRGQYKLSIV